MKKPKSEKDKERNHELNKIGLVSFFVIMTVAIICLFQPVTFEAELECNTGFIGIGLEGNETHMDNFTLQNIDGMYCKGKVYGQAPLVSLR